jgi:hypothetical protein
VAGPYGVGRADARGAIMDSGGHGRRRAPSLNEALEGSQITPGSAGPLA